MSAPALALAESHVPGTFLQPYLEPYVPWLYVDSWLWMMIGLLGVCMFSMRFVVQWLASERRRELIVPPLFWHLSFWGSTITLIYAFHVDKFPIILGNIFLPILHGRNLVLLYRGQRKQLAKENTNEEIETLASRT
jgi:lipid-A-disaccharide synthase-like uncharacterized protein